MKAFLSKLCKDVAGNVLMVGGFGSLALIGGAGLGVDTVQWYLWKRQLQQAVNSSALAGAQARAQGSNYTTYATKELNRNANTTLTVTRMVNPPVTGAYTGSNLAVEVIATTSQRLPFSSVFLSTAPTITARAVATTVTEGEHCVITLAKDGIGVSVGGSANVLLGCGVSANSTALNSIDLGGSSYLQASPLSAVGGIDYSGSNIQSGADIQPYGVEQADPIAARGLSVPSSPSGCTANNYHLTPSNNDTIAPGRYCGGLFIQGDLTMSPGVYILDRGDFKINSTATVVGEGVTIILTGNTPSNIATLSFQGGADIQLRAPTKAEDATWYNILFYQDPAANFLLSTINGDSNLDIEGVVYMPNGRVKFNGNSGQHADCLLLVSYRVILDGTSSLGNTCPSDYDEYDLSARRVRVVE